MFSLDKVDEQIEAAGVRGEIREQVRALISARHQLIEAPELQVTDYLGDLESEVAVAVYLVEHCSGFDPNNLAGVQALLTGVKVFDINHFEIVKTLIGEDDMSDFLAHHQGKDFLNPNSPGLKRVLLHYLPQYVAQMKEQFAADETQILYPQNSNAEGQQILARLFESTVPASSFDVASGYFGNVLIGKHCKYVFKVSKRELKPKVHQPTYTLPALDEHGGKEFIPHQYVIQGKNGRVAVLQEKLDLNPLKCVNVYTPKNELTEFLKPALQSPNNRDKLGRFVQWFWAIVSNYKMMPDLVGENLFMGIDANGELDIKFVDTKECWDLGPEKDPHNDEQIGKITHLIEFLETLRQLH